MEVLIALAGVFSSSIVGFFMALLSFLTPFAPIATPAAAATVITAPIALLTNGAILGSFGAFFLWIGGCILMLFRAVGIPIIL